jgi:hypothetical protein
MQLQICLKSVLFLWTPVQECRIIFSKVQQIFATSKVGYAVTAT